MKARKFVVALLTVAVALAFSIALAIPAAFAEIGPIAWLVGPAVIACARAGGRAVWGASKPIKVHPRSTVKQKAPDLGTNCYVGYPSRGSHESQLTTYCPA